MDFIQPIVRLKRVLHIFALDLMIHQVLGQGCIGAIGWIVGAGHDVHGDRQIVIAFIAGSGQVQQLAIVLQRRLKQIVQLLGRFQFQPTAEGGEPADMDQVIRLELGNIKSPPTPAHRLQPIGARFGQHVAQEATDARHGTRSAQRPLLDILHFLV